ncbi:MAG TPA: hypothetical protein PLG41_00280, partial [Leptospiraceae bacterium]|nr:hypothetical protein [Leptospiraceae bacterium]
MNFKSIILILCLSFFSLLADDGRKIAAPVESTDIEQLSDTYENLLVKSLEEVDNAEDDLDIDDISANSGINPKNNP